MAQLAELGIAKAMATRVAVLMMKNGAIGLVWLANKNGRDEIDVARAFTQLGEALGIDWLQGLAEGMSPSDPWERLLVAGSARELQQMRLAFLAKVRSKDNVAFVTDWLVQNEGAIAKFHRLIDRVRAVASPSAAMIAEMTGQARALLER